MTAKDKKLVIIAAVALISLAILMFGIKPAITNFTEANGKKAQLKTQKQTMQTEINNIASYEGQLKVAVDEYNKTAARVYADLSNDQIHDAVVNELVTPSGLQITTLTIGAIDRINLGKYNPVAENPENVTADQATAEPAATQEQATNPLVRAANISANVYGTQSQVIAFLDTLNADEGISLQQVSFVNSAEGGTSVTVTFYMVLRETF